MTTGWVHSLLPGNSIYYVPPHHEDCSRVVVIEGWMGRLNDHDGILYVFDPRTEHVHKPKVNEWGEHLIGGQLFFAKELSRKASHCVFIKKKTGDGYVCNRCPPNIEEYLAYRGAYGECCDFLSDYIIRREATLQVAINKCTTTRNIIRN